MHRLYGCWEFDSNNKQKKLISIAHNGLHNEINPERLNGAALKEADPSRLEK